MEITEDLTKKESAMHGLDTLGLHQRSDGNHQGRLERGSGTGSVRQGAVKGKGEEGKTSGTYAKAC